MSEYYILSLKWTRHDKDCLTWWCPKNSGYTTRLEHAGRYTEAEVRARPDYYDNRDSTVAIPCDLVDKFASRVVLAAGSRSMLTELLGEPADLHGTTIDDTDYHGRDRCPDCERGYGKPGPSLILFDDNPERKAGT